MAAAAFSGEPVTDPDVLDVLYKEIGGFVLTPELLGGDVVGLAVASGLFASNGEARRAITQGGLSVDGRRVTAPDEKVPSPGPGGHLLVRAGKKRLAVGKRPD